MALCVAHATAGYLVYEAVRPAGPHRPGLLVAALALANAPDLDFLPGILVGSPTACHRGLTHTIAAALAVGLLAWGLARRGWLRGASARRWGVIALGAWASHLAVDWLTVDAVPPHGARFLWPVVGDHLHAPVAVFGEIVVDTSSRSGFVGSLVTPAALLAWARELAVSITLVTAAALLRVLAREAPALGLGRVEPVEQAEP